jgi:hypothetical protein
METSESCDKLARQKKFEECDLKEQIERLRQHLRHALSRIRTQDEMLNMLQIHKHDAHTGEPLSAVNRGRGALHGGQDSLE